MVTLEDDDLLLQRRHLHPEFAAVLGLLRQRVLQLLDLHNLRSVRISSAVPLHLPVQGTAPWSAQRSVTSHQFSRSVTSTCSRESSLVCTTFGQFASVQPFRYIYLFKVQLLGLHNVRSLRISSAVPLHLPVQGTAPWSAQRSVTSHQFSRSVTSTCSRYSSLICTMCDQPAHLISAIMLDLPVHGTVP